MLLINSDQLKCENMHSVLWLLSIAILWYKRIIFHPKLY